MDDKVDAFFIGAIVGAILIGIILFVVQWALDIDAPDEHYVQNVCEYKGGVMKDDVCIVNGRVVEIDLP